MSEATKFARMVDDAVLNGTLLDAYRKGLRDARAQSTATITALADALRACRAKFAQYAEHYWAAATSDATVKAQANERMIGLIDAALAKLGESHE